MKRDVPRPRMKVIKIEAPKRLDQLRAGGFGYLVDNDPADAGWNRCSTFQMLNRGKRSFVLDLQTEAGRAVLCELVACSDVLIDNFTPRVMRGWGLSYEKLAQINPRLVMLSNTGYGSSGPWSAYKAQGTTLEATMGLGAYAGYDGEAPAKVGQSYPDFLAAWAGLTCIMAALVHRERSGKGQWIDLGMYQLGPLVIPEAFIAVQSGRPDIGCRGNADWGAAFSGVFRSRGTDQWVALSAADPAACSRLASLTGANAGADDDTVRATVAEWCKQRSAEEAAATLQCASIAAGPVRNARDLMHDPHLAARGFLERVDFGSNIGPRALIGRPYVWTGAEVGIRRRAPQFGEDNETVLATLLHKAPEAIDALRQQRIVTERPLNPPTLRPVDLSALVRLGTIKAYDPHYSAHPVNPESQPLEVSSQ